MREQDPIQQAADRSKSRQVLCVFVGVTVRESFEHEAQWADGQIPSGSY